MSLLDDFLTRAALAGLGVVLATAPLGCFVVWRRMAYFGDATAHAAVLGVALSLAFSMSLFIGTLASALAMGLIVSTLSGRTFAMDTALGVLAHSALAAGLIGIALNQNVRVDVMAYLFGDILAVSRLDVGLIWLGAASVAILMIWRWQALLTITLSPDLAYSEGINPRREQLILTLALALAVAVAIKVVGALLIGALLIIPTATARSFSGTPEGMALGAALIGATSVFAGLGASYNWDTPAGPSIVCAAMICFTISLLAGRARV